jgi:hypothetical protein
MVRKMKYTKFNFSEEQMERIRLFQNAISKVQRLSELEAMLDTNDKTLFGEESLEQVLVEHQEIVEELSKL